MCEEIKSYCLACLGACMEPEPPKEGGLRIYHYLYFIINHNIEFSVCLYA